MVVTHFMGINDHLFLRAYDYLIIFLKIQYSNNIPRPIDEKPIFPCANLNKTIRSSNKSHEDNLSVACYLQVHGLLGKLSITAGSLRGVDNRGAFEQLSTAFQQVFHRVFHHERHDGVVWSEYRARTVLLDNGYQTN